MGNWNTPFQAAPDAQQAAPLPPPPRLGNICVTQAGNYPGPFNPVGMGCVANMPWGPMSGTVM